jgi:cytoskeletal protein RodZ
MLVFMFRRTYDLNPLFSARKNNNSFSNTKEERAALIYNYPVTHTGDKIVFEQSYFFTHEQQVFTPPSTTTSTSTTTTTTTTAPATTTTTTAATTTAGEVTRPNTELPGTTAAQSHGKKSAASAHNSVAYVTLCTAMFLAWVVKQ